MLFTFRTGTPLRTIAVRLTVGLVTVSSVPEVRKNAIRCAYGSGNRDRSGVNLTSTHIESPTGITVPPHVGGLVLFCVATTSNSAAFGPSIQILVSCTSAVPVLKR